MSHLQGKTVIVTGGGRAVLKDGSCGSIGYGIATAYAKEGANLVITGRNVAKLEKAKEELERLYGIKVLALAADIAAGEFEAAAIVIGEMLEEKPNGAAALNLKAAMETAQGKYKDAEKTLDRAIMSNPRSHYAYYNMARLVLQTRSDGKMTARRYYETGRAVGGPVDDELEGMVK